jgi:putative endonuclease
MYYAYVIESLNEPTYHYKGHCEFLDKRLIEHNNGKTKSNKHYAPFKLVYFESFDLLMDAVKTEKYWKTAAGRRYLKKMMAA